MVGDAFLFFLSFFLSFSETFTAYTLLSRPHLYGVKDCAISLIVKNSFLQNTKNTWQLVPIYTSTLNWYRFRSGGISTDGDAILLLFLVSSLGKEIGIDYFLHLLNALAFTIVLLMEDIVVYIVDLFFFS